MNVLSLFDGMSCGRITLSELGIPVEKYYASEVDKFAIKATMQNFPDTIQLGDVRELEVSRLDKIDLIIGGSPCTNLSMSGKRKGLSTKEGMEVLDLQTYLELKENGFEFEGQSYLFWEYIRIYHELIKRGDNPKFFLENVEMGKKWESVFNETKYQRFQNAQYYGSGKIADSSRRIHKVSTATYRDGASRKWMDCRCC